MRNKIFISFIILFVVFSKGFSQTVITGKVYSENNDTIKFFDLLVLSPKDSSILTGNSFTNGFFTLKVKKENMLLLKVLSLGYEDKYLKVEVNGKDRINIGKITLKSLSQIEEVVIKVKKPVIKRQNGNLIIDIKNSSIKNAVNMQELFRKAPGVLIDKSNNIIVIGKGSPLIFINDREIFSKTELDALRPSDISYIEIIRHPGAEYAASAAAVIKIYTKKLTRDKLNASISNSLYYGQRLSNISEIKIQSKIKKFTNLLSFTQQFWNYTDFEQYEEYIRQNSGSVFENKGNTFSDKSADATKLFFTSAYKFNIKHKIAAQVSLLAFTGKDSVKTEQSINSETGNNYLRTIKKFKETKKYNTGGGFSYYYTPDTLRKFSVIFD